jgi:hypothetical protein
LQTHPRQIACPAYSFEHHAAVWQRVYISRLCIGLAYYPGPKFTIDLFPGPRLLWPTLSLSWPQAMSLSFSPFPDVDAFARLQHDTRAKIMNHTAKAKSIGSQRENGQCDHTQSGPQPRLEPLLWGQTVSPSRAKIK